MLKQHCENFVVIYEMTLTPQKRINKVKKERTENTSVYERKY